MLPANTAWTLASAQDSVWNLPSQSSMETSDRPISTSVSASPPHEALRLLISETYVVLHTNKASSQAFTSSDEHQMCHCVRHIVLSAATDLLAPRLYSESRAACEDGRIPRWTEEVAESPITRSCASMPEAS
eukprot:193588-Rhodomonas_salina.1